MVKADAFDVEYLGTGTGPAVILLHSSASGLRQWKRLIDDLGGRYRILAVNLFGYGTTSPWPPADSQTLADQAALVAAVAARVDGPVTLVGHSLGGAVALETALTLGERLQRVIAYEPILFSLLRTYGPAEAFAEIQNIAMRYRALGTAGEWDEAGEWFVDYWSGEGAWASMPDERRAGLRVMLPNVVHEWDAVMAPSHDLAGWDAIAAPVHILRAADTRLPTHAIASLLTQTHRSWQLHELVEGGHMAPLARPDLVNPLIGRLLAEAA
jgi:pimeloyl-ACP methyl ester carboxylesterase